ncbi:MAG: hypothetical protein L0215_09805 [Gemmataceae bacterium]|nr:hypothetical protein [Gemmataceae bacterium]
MTTLLPILKHRATRWSIVLAGVFGGAAWWWLPTTPRSSIPIKKEYAPMTWSADFKYLAAHVVESRAGDWMITGVVVLQGSQTPLFIEGSFLSQYGGAHFLPGTDKMAFFDGQRLRIWDVAARTEWFPADGRSLRVPSDCLISRFVRDRAGHSFLVCGLGDGSLLVYDPLSGLLVSQKGATLAGHERFEPFIGGVRTIGDLDQFWEIPSFKLLEKMNRFEQRALQPSSFEWNAEGELAGLHIAQKHVTFWNVTTGAKEEIQLDGLCDIVLCATRRLAAGRVQRTPARPSWLQEIARRLGFAIDNSGAGVTIIDLATRKEVAWFPEAMNARLSADECLLAVSYPGREEVYDFPLWRPWPRILLAAGIAASVPLLLRGLGAARRRWLSRKLNSP